MLSCVVDNVNVKVAQNEPVVHHVFNRNNIQLLNNDIALYKLYQRIFNQLNITDYNPDVIYKTGALVWFQDDQLRLYLLKNLIPDNMNYPDILDFESSGWKNCNTYVNVLDFGITQIINQKVTKAYQDHVKKDGMHPLGKISLDEDSVDYIGGKLLDKNLVSLNKNRSHTFFPNTVQQLTPDGAIINGYYKLYDNNVIEYDIIFRFGIPAERSGGSVLQDTDISANNIGIKSYNGVSTNAASYNENVKYFRSTGDMSIFDDSNLSGQSVMGLLTQHNRNDFANTYKADITFPFKFRDLNYMIYTNEILSQATEGKVIPSSNEIVFVNKTKDSVTALNITYPAAGNYQTDGFNTANNGLISNSFHCKVIGIKADV